MTARTYIETGVTSPDFNGSTHKILLSKEAIAQALAARMAEAGITEIEFPQGHVNYGNESLKGIFGRVVEHLHQAKGSVADSLAALDEERASFSRYGASSINPLSDSYVTIIQLGKELANEQAQQRTAEQTTEIGDR